MHIYQMVLTSSALWIFHDETYLFELCIRRYVHQKKKNSLLVVFVEET